METAQTLERPAPPMRPDGQRVPSDHDEIDLNVQKPGGAWVLLAAMVAIVLLGALLMTGLIPRLHETKELAGDSASQASAPVAVNVARPHRAPTEVNVVIPGNLRPWQEVSIFARTTGYLKKYYVDISEHVEAGQLMADIDSPEIDQELGQSQAALVQSKTAAGQALASPRTSATGKTHWEMLLERRSVAELEEILSERLELLRAR